MEITKSRTSEWNAACERAMRDGFGYCATPVRFECRPTYGPDSKKDLLRKLDLLVESGVKAWWYSVSSKGSYPMFPSKYLPFRSDAVDYFPWLVEEAHKRGIALISWEYMTTAPLLAEKNPEWRWQFFEHVGDPVLRDSHYVCWNSPYGELLKQFSVEVTGELGFDGIWFDGTFLHGHGTSGTFACCCSFCREKFMKSTGERFPEKVDFHDPDFRNYLEWRAHDHIRYWRSLAHYVKERVPQAVIAYNYFNRFDAGVLSGTPLLRLAEDAQLAREYSVEKGMPALIAPEISFYSQQTPLLSKTLRAVNDYYPPELWCYGMDAPDTVGKSLDPSMWIFHGNTCAANGTYPSVGLSSFDKYAMSKTTDHMEQIAPYIGGDPIASVGVLLSGATKDFAHIQPDGKTSFHQYAMQTWHGLDNLLNSIHIPYEVLLDNMLEERLLNRYKAIILPEVICMDDSALPALQEYVKAGGFILAIGETATRDRIGTERETGLLDSLLGIGWRDKRIGSLEISLDDNELLKAACSLCSDEDAPLFTRPYQPSGKGFLVRPSEDAEVLASASYPTNAVRRFGPNGILPPDGKLVEGAAIIREKHGSGQCIYLTINIAGESARVGTTRRNRLLLASLLRDVGSDFKVDAPICVTVNPFLKDGKVILHILNMPDRSSVLGLDPPHNLSLPVNWPVDVIPTGPVKVEIPGVWEKVEVVFGCPKMTSAIGDSGVFFEIPLLDHYAIVTLTPGEKADNH